MYSQDNIHTITRFIQDLMSGQLDPDKFMNENSSEENEEVLGGFFELYNECREFKVKEQLLLSIQEALFSYTQFDFSTKINQTSTNDLINALICSVNIFGEELKAVFEENEKQKSELKALLTKNEELMQFKDNFLSKISHEMRTPLNSIIGFTELMMNDRRCSEVKKPLTIISKQSKVLLALIDDILDLTKIKSDTFALEHDNFSLIELMRSNTQRFKALIKEKDLKLNLHYDEQLCTSYTGDKTHLGQVLLNLISNAVKFTCEGKIDVKVHLIKRENNRDKIKFEISDTGVGINKENLATIMKLFVQNTNNPNYQNGAGLGLSISQNILQIMGSELRVESKLNEGSTFFFYLDLEQVIQSNNPDHKTHYYNFDGKKILIVDDNPCNLLLLSEILSGWGIQCEEAENGKVAIDILTENSPKFDLVIMDLQMPVLDGISSTKTIRNKLKLNIPIVGLSANTLEADVSKSLKSGMNGFLSKPINQPQLLSELSKWIAPSINTPSKKQ